MAYRATVTLPLCSVRQRDEPWYGQKLKTAPDIHSHTSELVKKLHVTHGMIQQNFRDSQIPMKKYYNIRTQEPKFEIGSKVLLHDTATKPGEFPNLRKDGSSRS